MPILLLSIFSLFFKILFGVILKNSNSMIHAFWGIIICIIISTISAEKLNAFLKKQYNTQKRYIIIFFISLLILSIL